MKPFLLLILSVLLQHECSSREATSSLPCLGKASKIWVEVEVPVTGWYYKISNRMFHRHFARGIHFVLSVTEQGAPEVIYRRDDEGRRKRLSYKRDNITLSCPDAPQSHCRCRALRLSGLPDYNGEYALTDPLNTSQKINFVESEEDPNLMRSPSILGDNGGKQNTPDPDDDDCETGQFCKDASQDIVYDILADNASISLMQNCRRAQEYISQRRNSIWWMRNSDFTFKSLLHDLGVQEKNSNAFRELISIPSPEMKLMKQQFSEPLKSHKQKRWAIAKSVNRLQLQDLMNDSSRHSSKQLRKMNRNWKAGNTGRKWSRTNAYRNPIKHPFENTIAGEDIPKSFNYHGSMTSGSFLNGVSPDYLERNSDGTEDAEACDSYYQLQRDVRLERDEALEAWTLAVGNQLLAISDFSTLCPDSASGDWWWVQTAPPEVSELQMEAASRETHSVDLLSAADDGDYTLLTNKREHSTDRRKLNSDEFPAQDLPSEKGLLASLGRNTPTPKVYPGLEKLLKQKGNKVPQFPKSRRSRSKVQRPVSHRNAATDSHEMRGNVMEVSHEEPQVLPILEYSESLDYDDAEKQSGGENYGKLIRKNVMAAKLQETFVKYLDIETN